MSELGYLLRALLGKPDVELNNAQVRAEGDAMLAQSRYNQWRRKTGRIPVDYNRVRSIVSGERTSPLLNHPVNYNDPADVWRAHKNMMDYARIVGAEASPNEKAYQNMEIAPRDKATMGAPLDVRQQPSQRVPEPAQEKVAGIVGKADIKVHPEDDQGNIVTLLKGIRGKWNGLNYRVPKGFESDGVSTPSILWPIISPPVHPHTIRGGIIHDWLYRHQPRGWTREQADKVFRDVIEEDGLTPLQADLAYIGLRMFGDKAWDENAKRRLIERAAQRAKNKRTNNTEAEAGQVKAASEEHTMITYTQAYEMRKQAASQYENERLRTISSAESTARSAGVKPMPRAEAERFYDKNRADAAKKRIEEDRAKRTAENNRREEARLKAKQQHLNNSRYLNSQYGRTQQAQLQGQLDKQKVQYAARTAPKNTNTQVAARKPATKSTVSSPVRVANAAKKRAPGIYNAQGQKWNGSAFV